MTPTERQICPIPEDLDGQVAARNFLGLDVAGALSLIRENSLYYLSDFLWMGPVAFRYYLPALTKYFAEFGPEVGADCVTSLLSTFNLRLQNEPSECLPIRQDMANILIGILSRYDELGVDEDIYGDLRQEIRNTLEKLNEK